jgi:hypothetical protein
LHQQHLRVLNRRLIIGSFSMNVHGGTYSCMVQQGDHKNSAFINLDSRSLNENQVSIKVKKLPLEIDDEKRIELICETGIYVSCF